MGAATVPLVETYGKRVVVTRGDGFFIDFTVRSGVLADDIAKGLRGALADAFHAGAASPPAGRTFVLTAAPAAYDYGYVTEHGSFDSQRLVSIPDEHVAYQTARYQSGLYATRVADEG